MGIVPVGLKEKMDRYLRNNAERTDAHLGDVTSDSLSTEDANINLDGVEGQTESLFDYTIPNSLDESDKRQRTNDVSDTEVEIATETNDVTIFALAIITGSSNPSGDDRFCDVLIYGNVATPQVIGTATAGNPDSRSYSLAFPGLTLAMGVSSPTYDVAARLIEVGL